MEFRKLLFISIFIHLLSGIAIVSIFLWVDLKAKESAARSIAQSVRNDLFVGDYRTVVLGLEAAKVGNFDSYQVIKPDAKALVRPSALPFGSKSISVDIEMNSENDNGTTKIIFFYRPFALLVYPLITWLLTVIVSVPLFKFALRRIKQDHDTQLILMRADALVAMSQQVSHDIRSPLSALNMAVGSLHGLPEDRRLLIRNATNRINDIANQLLQNGRRDGSAPTPTKVMKAEPILLVALLDSLISEKRIQFRDRMQIEIHGDLSQGYGLFASVDATELSRAVSNLVNNAVEAAVGFCRVTITAKRNNGHATVIVSDNGKGIPADILARIGKRGVTHGKDGTDSGSGLGIFHARSIVENVGGSLNIQSQSGVGTTVTITLPVAPTPTWFLQKIQLPVNSTVVSIDDDQTIHQVWAGRMSSAGANRSNIQHMTFSSTERISEWVKSCSDQAQVFLVDYEFIGRAENGLDLIQNLEISDRSILVTSRYEERIVRDRAELIGVKILPKMLAPFVPLYVALPQVIYDAVLIDDDSLVQAAWQIASEEKGKSLICFSSAEEFFAQANQIHRHSPLYIDVNLAEGIRGEDVALKAAELGFREIRLATGYDATELDVPPCVRAVVGKDPVF